MKGLKMCGKHCMAILKFNIEKLYSVRNKAQELANVNLFASDSHQLSITLFNSKTLWFYNMNWRIYILSLNINHLQKYIFT